MVFCFSPKVTKCEIFPTLFHFFGGKDEEPYFDWNLARPAVSDTYFHNNYLGSIFFAADIRKEKPVSLKEYEILLQFVVHRFDLVEVHLSIDSYQDFIIALNKIASSGLIGPTNQFLIYFDASKTEEGEKLQSFYQLLNFTKLTLGNNCPFLKGISFGFKESRETNIGNLQTLNETNSRNKMLLEQGKRLDLKISMGVSDCQNLHSYYILSTGLQQETNSLLKMADFIICIDSVDVNTFDNPKGLGGLLDSHLYTKKLFLDYQPHLDLYVRVLVKVPFLDARKQEHLIMLSHFKKFAATYNVSYIIVNAFESESCQGDGWWAISNFSNLALTSVYEEKYSAFEGFETWRPHSKPTLRVATDNKNVIVAVVVPGVVCTIVTLLFIRWYYKNKAAAFLSAAEESEFRHGRQGNTEQQASGDSDYLKFDSNYELPFGDICIDPKDLLGRGNFGTVYKGLVKEEPVAIKRPNENCPATSFKSVLCEIKVLCYIGTHPNVIRFIGAYTKQIRRGILYIATELCSNGSLDGLLRAKNRVVSVLKDVVNQTTGMEDAVYSHDLHRFTKEIASGMDYISGKNVIHGDLLARNVLLDENFTCKIGDFGLSRKLNLEYLEYVKQSQEPLPWKWMAYESLKNMQFTTKSDVWSYGVTLWEIYSLGSVPYGGLSWTTGFADDLKNGLRLQMPEYATEEIYNIILSCWNLNVEERPTFSALVDFYTESTSSQYTVLES